MSKNNFCTVSSVKEIMEKMGFNKNAPIDTQVSFLKHLLNKYNVNDENIKNKNYQNEEDEQLDLFKIAS